MIRATIMRLHRNLQSQTVSSRKLQGTEGGPKIDPLQGGHRSVKDLGPALHSGVLGSLSCMLSRLSEKPALYEAIAASCEGKTGAGSIRLPPPLQGLQVSAQQSRTSCIEGPPGTTLSITHQRPSANVHKQRAVKPGLEWRSQHVGGTKGSNFGSQGIPLVCAVWSRAGETFSRATASPRNSPLSARRLVALGRGG